MAVIGFFYLGGWCCNSRGGKRRLSPLLPLPLAITRLVSKVSFTNSAIEEAPDLAGGNYRCPFSRLRFKQ